MTRSYIGEITAQIALTEALLARVAARLDAGGGVSVDLFSVCKIVASEFACEAADRLIQVLGSRGYDEANGAAQLLRDARVTRIFEGTTEALIAYVGSQALVPSSDIYEFLRTELGAAELAETLERSVREMRGRRFAAVGPAADLPRPWQCALAGWAAAWALLAAAGERELQTTRSEPLARAVAWARLRFGEACAAAAGGSSREHALLSAADAEACVAGYAHTIGDVEQQLPGEREGLDPLLRR